MLKRKMDEYIENGLQLGWLIEPKQKTVHIYRPHLPVEVRDNPNTLSADPILSGFILDLTGNLVRWHFINRNGAMELHWMSKPFVELTEDAF